MLSVAGKFCGVVPPTGFKPLAGCFRFYRGFNRLGLAVRSSLKKGRSRALKVPGRVKSAGQGGVWYRRKVQKQLATTLHHVGNSHLVPIVYIQFGISSWLLKHP